MNKEAARVRAAAGPTTMSYGEYDALPGLRWSLLKWMRRSPLHFRYAELNWEEVGRTTQVMWLGNGTHTAILEPERFEREWHRGPDVDRTKADWKAFERAHPDGELMTVEEYSLITGAAAAVQANPVAAHYVQRGISELTLTWTDLLTLLDCKVRCDLVNGHLIEIKTSNDVSGGLFAKTAANFGYVEQLAFYRMGLVENGYQVAENAIIIAVEMKRPHDVVPYSIPRETLDLGESKVRELMARVRRCRDTGAWPGQSEGETPLVMPKWWYDDEAERERAEFDKIAHEFRHVDARDMSDIDLEGF